jgi:hypothetical protein
MTQLRGRRAAVIAAWCLPALVMASQQTRDAAPPVPVGTGSLSGIVVSADDPAVPIRRAIVTLAGVGLGGDRSVVSDDAGGFMFDDLPAGSFTVTASKAAYLSASFGAKRPARPGTPVAVPAGQGVTGIHIPLARGGVIAGAVHGTDGAPVPGLRVLAVRAGDPPLRLLPGFALTDATLTDDRGAYRLYGLEPGTYTVVALVTTAQLTEMHRRSAAEIDAAFREAQQKGSAPATPPASVPVFAAAPIYYPGTAFSAQAASIDVAAGSTHDDVSFVADAVPSVAIDGVVERPAGASGAVTLVISGAGSATPLTLTMGPHLVLPPGPDGRFRYVNVTPGHYTITAVMTESPGPGQLQSGTGRGAVPAPSADRSPSLSWATAAVDASGDDIAGLALVMQPGLSLSGRVVFDAVGAKAPDPTAVRISALPLNAGGNAMVNGTSYGAPQRGAFARAREDGAFEMTGLVPGVYRLTVTTPGSSQLEAFWTRSAVADDRDILDTQVTVTPGQNIERIVVTLTDRHTALSGTLTTPAGQPAAGYFVIVLPADRALWRPDARRIRSIRPATDGRFEFADLPPGPYVLAAVDDLEPADLADRTFLETLAAAGIPLALGEGEKKWQDLKIAR